MFEQVFDSMRKAAAMNAQFQQELVKRWLALWPGMAAPVPPPGDQAVALQKKWSETVSELVKRQHETQQELFAAGLQQIDQTFRLADIKDVETLRAKTLELWQRTFGMLQQGYEAQVRDFQTAVAKWTELMTTKVA
jgi:hypothetical protein